MLGASLALAVAAGLLLWLGARLWRSGAPGSAERWLALTFGSLGCGVLPRFVAARLLSAYELGAAGYVVKPIALDGLAEAVDLVVRYWRLCCTGSTGPSPLPGLA